MKKVFKQYYLRWLIISILLIGLLATTTILSKNGDKFLNLASLLIFLLGVVIITFGVGGVYHWFFEVYRPKRIGKLFNKIKVYNLLDLGLNLDEKRHCYQGRHQGYYITVLTDSTPHHGEWISTNVFVNPKEDQRENLQRLIKKFELNAHNGLVWMTSKTRIKFGRIPKEEQLKSDIDNLVKTLMSEKIGPRMMIE